MITSFATVRTMMSICDIFMKTLYGGITTNYTPKNRGMGFALCLCNTNAKLAIKPNDNLSSLKLGYRYNLDITLYKTDT